MKSTTNPNVGIGVGVLLIVLGAILLTSSSSQSTLLATVFVVVGVLSVVGNLFLRSYQRR